MLACSELYLLPERDVVVAMVVTSGSSWKSGRRVGLGAQVAGSPTPGSAWLPSVGRHEVGRVVADVADLGRHARRSAGTRRTRSTAG